VKKYKEEKKDGEKLKWDDTAKKAKQKESNVDAKVKQGKIRTRIMRQGRKKKAKRGSLQTERRSTRTSNED
jgi:hypothetical protein